LQLIHKQLITNKVNWVYCQGHPVSVCCRL